MWNYRRGSKFNAKKILVSGVWFHSKLEAAVYKVLLFRERAGEIKILKLQKRVMFKTEKHGEVIMIPDFWVRDVKTGEEFFVEAKGFETRDWLRKKKAWKINGPGRMEIWQGSHLCPVLREILIPQTTNQKQDAG